MTVSIQLLQFPEPRKVYMTIKRSKGLEKVIKLNNSEYRSNKLCLEIHPELKEEKFLLKFSKKGGILLVQSEVGNIKFPISNDITLTAQRDVPTGSYIEISRLEKELTSRKFHVAKSYVEIFEL